MEKNDDSIFEIKVGEQVRPDPLVSVVIPAYNCSPYISESVRAVLSQTFDDCEVIVVNDGSKDTEDLESALADHEDKITYIRRRNGGPGAARNSGIRVSKGEFLAFVDGDDVWRPQFLERQLNALKEKGCDLIYCDARYFGEGLKEGRTFSERSPSEGPVTVESLILGKCNVILSGTLLKKKAVVEFGMFKEEGLPMAIEDYELWVRLCSKGVKIDYQREILLDYRVHQSNISGSMLRIVERSLAGIRYVKETIDLNDTERLAADESIRVFESQLNMERAKVLLAHGRFEESLKYMQLGASKNGNKKLRAIAGIMSLSPSILLFLFKKFRREEFEQALNENPALVAKNAV